MMPVVSSKTVGNIRMQKLLAVWILIVLAFLPGFAEASSKDAPTTGSLSLSCSYDYDQRTDRPFSLNDLEGIAHAAQQCQGLLHVYFRGQIDPSLASIIVGINRAISIQNRTVKILDIDSGGGDVNAALLAGESLFSGDWAVWVKKRSNCFSACVFILAGGTNRSIGGSVGVHRIINPASLTKNAADLQSELTPYLVSIKNYLSKFGANPSLVDLMMTVPSKDIRILKEAELVQFGLDGQNSVKADLRRLEVTRRCGADFVRRWDEFGNAGKKCVGASSKVRTANAEAVFDACLRKAYSEFKFPDPKCPNDGPRLP